MGSEFTFGPTIALAFPIQIAVQGIILDTGIFGLTGSQQVGTLYEYDADQGTLLAGTKPANLGDPAYRPATVGLRYVWSWGITVRLGIWAKIKVAWVFSIAPEFSFDVLSLIGINTNVGTGVTGDLTNTAFVFAQQMAQAGVQPVEVLFEDMEPVYS